MIYAGSARAIVLYRLLTDGLIALAWVFGAAGTGAYVLRPLLRDKDRLIKVFPSPALPRSTGGGRSRAIVDGHSCASPDHALRQENEAPGPGEAPTNGVLFFVTSAALGLGLIGLAALGLGLAGLLNAVTSIALVLPGFPLGWFALRARRLDRRTVAAPRFVAEKQLRPNERPRSHWLWLATAPFLAVALAGTMVPPGLLWNPQEPHGYDVAEYHLQVPREWYEAGRIVPLKHNVFSYFPMGVEVHYLMAMEIDGGPWNGMYLAQLMHLALIVLTVLGAWGVALQFAPDRASATVAAVALATIPWMAQLGAIAYNEGGLLLYGTVSIGWVMRGLTAAAGSPSRLRRFALAGACAGFACGAKLTAVPELLIAVPVALGLILLFPCGLINTQRGDPAKQEAGAVAHGIHSGTSDGPEVRSSDLSRLSNLGPRAAVRSWLGISLVYGIAALLTLLPWLARNAVWTGNPVFPEAASVFGKAHLNDVQVERLKRANHEPGPDRRGAVGHVRAVWDQLLGDWQFGYLLLPLSVVSIARLTVRRYTRRPSGAAVPLPALMLSLLTIFWIGFTHLQSRFFLLGGPLAVIVIAQVDWGRWLRPVGGLVILAAVIGWWGVNNRFVSIVWQSSPDMRSSMVDAVGRSSLVWLNPEALDAFPRSPEALRDDPNARITLIGDSRAFYYQVPMSRLHYRTIFDLDTTGLGPAPDGPALAAAWSGRPPGSKPAPGEWQVIDDAELERFSKTYFGVPPPPPEWKDRTASFVLPPGHDHY
jgi:hypothetical protein